MGRQSELLFLIISMAMAGHAQLAFSDTDCDTILITSIEQFTFQHRPCGLPIKPKVPNWLLDNREQFIIAMENIDQLMGKPKEMTINVTVLLNQAPARAAGFRPHAGKYDPNSYNEHTIVIDPHFARTPTDFFSIIGHEYVHLLQHRLNHQQNSMMKEGLALLAEEIVFGVINVDPIRSYMQAPIYSFAELDQKSYADFTTADYGAAYSLIRYLFYKFSDASSSFYQSMSNNPNPGLDGLRRLFAHADWESASLHYAIASILNTPHFNKQRLFDLNLPWDVRKRTTSLPIEPEQIQLPEASYGIYTLSYDRIVNLYQWESLPTGYRGYLLLVPARSSNKALVPVIIDLPTQERIISAETLEQAYVMILRD